MCVAPLQAQTRLWTDNIGKFSIEAELVEIRQDNVVLKKADGATVTVPIARLSDADQKHLKFLEQPGSQAGAQSSHDADVGAPLSFPGAVTEPPSWNDTNVPFDLAALLQAPPVEENAAPLYLAAFIEFGKSEMSHFFPEMPEHELKQLYAAERQLSKEQRRLEEAWEKKFRQRSIPRPSTHGWRTTTPAMKCWLPRSSGAKRVDHGRRLLFKVGLLAWKDLVVHSNGHHLAQTL